MRLKRWLAAVVVAVVLGVAGGAAQPFSPEIQLAINQVLTGVSPFTAFRTVASSYLNWGTTQGTSGYGLRDNAGTIQVKNSGGSWANIVTGSTLPTAASFLTRVAESTLSNETALGSLGTGLLINTTTTGVPTIYAGVTCTNQFLRALSAIGASTCATVSLTADVSGLLPVANGGTGLTSGTPGGVLYFNAATTTIASSAALAVNQIVLGGGTGAPTVLGSVGTIATVLTGNASGAPSFAQVDLTTTVTGILPGGNGGTGNGFTTFTGPTTALKTFTLPDASATILTSATAITPAQGGTGITSYTIGDLIYASGATTLAKLADIAVGNALISGGVGVAPSWGKIGLTTHVTGTLPVANGGTAIASYTVGSLLSPSGATTITQVVDVAAGSYLRSGGVATLPVWSTLILPNAGTQGQVPVVSAANTVTMLAVGTAGQLLRSAGAGATPVWSTTIFPNSATTGDLMQATSANTYANLAAVATGNVLISGGVGTVSSWGKVALTTHVSGVLPALNGGTSVAGAGNNQILIGDGANWVATSLGNMPNGAKYDNTTHAWSAVTSPSYTQLSFNSILADVQTSPTIASGFGTSPTIPNNNGTIAFTINVGTGGTASSGQLTLPAGTTGWVCDVTNRTAVAANRADQHTVQTATTTNSITIQNQTMSTGAALAWTASDILAVKCRAY